MELDHAQPQEQEQQPAPHYEKIQEHHGYLAKQRKGSAATADDEQQALNKYLRSMHHFKRVSGCYKAMSAEKYPTFVYAFLVLCQMKIT